jgi:hypothetical protein
LFNKLLKFFYRKLNNTKIEFHFEDPKNLNSLVNEVIKNKRKELLISGKPKYIIYTLNQLNKTSMVTTLELFGNNYFVLNVILESNYLNDEFFIEVLFTVEEMDSGDKYFLPYELVIKGTINVTGYKYVKTF